MAAVQDEGVRSRLPGLERATVAGIAQRVVGSETAELRDWRVEVVEAGMGAATGGVYRVAGNAVHDGTEVGWSVMLKVVSASAPRGHIDFRDEAHPLYWKREALAYTSGLLDDLPGGVRAPRCYDVVEVDGDTVWLWLEAVQDRHGNWGLEQYARAAECLGRFNGAYLAGRPLPAYSWLVKTDSPRGLLDHNAWLRDVIADPIIWQHPLVRAAFPIPPVDRLLQLWDEREMLLRALDRVPQTFCHLDAWRRNMFAPVSGGGLHGLTLIDWAYPGLGAVGTDPGDLFGESFCLSELRDIGPEVFDRSIFDSYVLGLQGAGWKGDVRTVRLAFSAFCALKHLFLLFVSLRDVWNERGQVVWERLFGRPFDEYVYRQARLLYYLLDMAEEAHGLVV